MNEENIINYPIAYAKLPLYINIDSNNKNPSNYVLQGHMLVKCFILEEKRVYNSNGSFKNSYVVYFPYQKNNLLENIFKEYNIDCKCPEVTIVDEIYNKYLSNVNENVFNENIIEIENSLNSSFNKKRVKK